MAALIPMFTLRLAKIALVAAVALYLLLVTFNNVTDYGSNHAFVAHVLAMDTTFESNQLRWRAIESPPFHHVAYVAIIIWEGLAALVCGAGAVRLWLARREPAGRFAAAKSLAVLGLTLSLLLWFVAFLTIGGEWFAMWQSRIWNGQEAAFRMFACTALVLLLLALEDRDLEPL